MSYSAEGDLNPVQSLGDRKVMLTGIVTLGSSGAISSQDCDGFTVAKTGSETGRYTVTLSKPGVTIEYAHAVVEGAADAAAAAAKGQVCQLRGVNAGSQLVYIQLLTPSLAGGASVDVEAENNAILRILLVVNRGPA